MQQPLSDQQVALLSRVGIFTVEARAAIVEIDRILRACAVDDLNRRRMWEVCQAALFKGIAPDEATPPAEPCQLAHYGARREQQRPRGYTFNSSLQRAAKR